ncbi:hypothetical protein E2C01_035901 [Portunus trituberculatus]|uniref:Uncharacterized protein n=1 Tax=Portunus trituberculatus TaxID=210409 RepID=A0A5B7F775_PORTR|nr:hypothetical protein [Portunus trituberculatus]
MFRVAYVSTDVTSPSALKVSPGRCAARHGTARTARHGTYGTARHGTPPSLPHQGRRNRSAGQAALRAGIPTVSHRVTPTGQHAYTPTHLLVTHGVTFPKPAALSVRLTCFPDALVSPVQCLSVRGEARRGEGKGRTLPHPMKPWRPVPVTHCDCLAL